jgi:signal transduction histidine kinase
VVAEQEVLSLFEKGFLFDSERSYWLSSIYLTQRRYSGNKVWDTNLAEFEVYLDNPNALHSFILSADWSIFKKDFNTANHLLQQALAKFDDAGENTIRIYATFSRLYTATNNFREALRIAKDGLALSQNIDIEPEVSAELYQSLVQAYLKSQEYGSLEEYASILLKLSKQLQDVEKQIVALNNLAIVSSIRNDFKTAMGYFIETLELGKKIAYRQSIANSLINIGTIYAHLQNHDEALKRYLNIIADYEDVLEANTLAIVYNNVGNINHRKNNVEQAHFYFKKTLEVAQKSQYQEMIALALTQISRTYRLENNTTEALIFAEESRQLMADLGDVNGQQINLINLGQLHYDLGDFESAILLTEEGLNISIAAEDELNMAKSYELLATIYAYLKNFEKAYTYQFAYTQLQESIENEQRNLQALDIEIRYDIREKQLLIEQLQRENQYQGQLLEQSKQIEQQNIELTQANEELQQFAYVVSHDLKEPLRMIASYIQLMFRRLPKELLDTGGDIETYSNFINEGVTRMNLLLDGLLQYATVGEEKEEKEDLDIREIADYATFNLKLLIQETNAEINIGKMPVLNVLASRFTQIFQNLLSNAIKFRKPDVAPIINISCEKNGKEYLFKVSDNGIGISAEHRDRVFVIFQRLHTRKQYEGTGIGLSICQKIIIRLGGKIWVESELGVGTTFCFTVPAV